MDIEKRKQKRILLRRDILINSCIKAIGTDLSVGGLYVYTGHPFKPKSIVKVTLPLKNDFISFQARVQYAIDGVGMGLMFVNIEKEQLAAIRSFIEASQEISNLTKKKILIIYDNATSMRLHKDKLVLDGYSVLEARNGVEALAQLGQGAVDLIVLGLDMEKLDGLKLLSIVRRNPEWCNTPVLVFSARNSSSKMEKAMIVGATEFLPIMTIDPAKMSERIKLHLANANY